VGPRTTEPPCGWIAALAKQKNVPPSGMTLYCLEITDGVRKALCTAHLAHEPEPSGKRSPVAEWRLEMLPATSTRTKCMGIQGCLGAARLQTGWATAS